MAYPLCPLQRVTLDTWTDEDWSMMIVRVAERKVCTASRRAFGAIEMVWENWTMTEMCIMHSKKK